MNDVVQQPILCEIRASGERLEELLRQQAHLVTQVRNNSARFRSMHDLLRAQTAQLCGTCGWMRDRVLVSPAPCVVVDRQAADPDAASNARPGLQRKAACP